jgi:hypothetical protein
VFLYDCACVGVHMCVCVRVYILAAIHTITNAVNVQEFPKSSRNLSPEEQEFYEIQEEQEFCEVQEDEIQEKQEIREIQEDCGGVFSSGWGGGVESGVSGGWNGHSWNAVRRAGRRIEDKNGRGGRGEGKGEGKEMEDGEDGQVGSKREEKVMKKETLEMEEACERETRESVVGGGKGSKLAPDDNEGGVGLSLSLSLSLSPSFSLSVSLFLSLSRVCDTCMHTRTHPQQHTHTQGRGRHTHPPVQKT